MVGMKCLIFVSLFGIGLGAGIYQNVVRNINLPPGMEIRRDMIRDAGWYKASGDPHGAIGANQHSNQSICFEFAGSLPSGSKLNLFSHDRQYWSISAELIGINKTASINHHNRMEKIFVEAQNFNVEIHGNKILYGGNEYKWNDALDTGASSSHRAHLDNGVLNIRMANNYRFTVYPKERLTIELTQIGDDFYSFNGALGQIHEYRLYYDNILGHNVGTNAVIEINMDGQFILATKVLHDTNRPGTDKYECWHLDPKANYLSNILQFVRL